MRTAIPPTADHRDALKQRLQREHDGHKKPRLQMLSLLASRQARTSQDVARLLRGPSQHDWPLVGDLRRRRQEALLDTYVPTGKLVSLAPDVLASLEQALHRPERFASSEAKRQWVARTHGVQIHYKTLYTLVRTRFNAEHEMARPSHTKNPEAIPVFQAT
jgi:hypothetical protein